MKAEKFYSLVGPFARKYWLPLCLATVGLILFVYGLISLLGSNSNEAKNFSQESSKPSTASNISQITVDVEGGVIKPGVYKLKVGSIIQDALIAASGLSKDANRSYISKNINLAAKVQDGQKVYIPVTSDNTILAEEESNVSNSTLININMASSDQLDSLPGIGLVTAQKVISNRPYATIEELLIKKVVSAKVFDGIKDKITAYLWINA